MNSSIEWRGQCIPIHYSARKTTAIQVERGEVTIRAPRQATTASLRRLIDERTPWLIKTLTRQQRRLAEQVDYGTQPAIPFMGLTIPLLKQTAKQNRWQLVDQGLALGLRELESRTSILGLLRDFYRTQAAFWLDKKTLELAQKAGLGAKLGQIGLRQTKTKWGHCTATGNIQYNWLIMMAPEWVIDYLVAHEVSHLRYHDHSKLFWGQVKALHSQYQDAKLWLRENGHRLELV